LTLAQHATEGYSVASTLPSGGGDGGGADVGAGAWLLEPWGPTRRTTHLVVAEGTRFFTDELARWTKDVCPEDVYVVTEGWLASCVQGKTKIAEKKYEI
jgi:hypothetical protein